MSFLQGHVFEGRTPFQKKTPKQQNKGFCVCVGEYAIPNNSLPVLSLGSREGTHD